MNNIKFNQQLLIYEMLKRGIKVNVLDDENDIIKTKYKDHFEIIYGMDSSIMPHSIVRLINDKGFVKKNLVNCGITTPAGASFKAKNIEYIKKVFNVINGPVTVKTSLVKSCVFNNLKTEEELENALNNIMEKYGPDTKVVIEEYYNLKEYHIFINKNGDYVLNNHEEVNPDIINICMEVLKAFPGLPYADISIMTNSIFNIQTEESYQIIGISNIPNINIFGERKEIYKYIVDMIYPETLDLKEKVMIDDNIKKL